MEDRIKGMGTQVNKSLKCWGLSGPTMVKCRYLRSWANLTLTSQGPKKAQVGIRHHVLLRLFISADAH